MFQIRLFRLTDGYELKFQKIVFNFYSANSVASMQWRSRKFSKRGRGDAS
jgi:nicotinic acid phosphoribosyltransferase